MTQTVGSITFGPTDCNCRVRPREIKSAVPPGAKLEITGDGVRVVTPDAIAAERERVARRCAEIAEAENDSIDICCQRLIEYITETIRAEFGLDGPKEATNAR